MTDDCCRGSRCERSSSGPAAGDHHQRLGPVAGEDLVQRHPRLADLLTSVTRYRRDLPSIAVTTISVPSSTPRRAASGPSPSALVSTWPASTVVPAPSAGRAPNSYQPTAYRCSAAPSCRRRRRRPAAPADRSRRGRTVRAGSCAPRPAGLGSVPLIGTAMVEVGAGFLPAFVGGRGGCGRGWWCSGGTAAPGPRLRMASTRPARRSSAKGGEPQCDSPPPTTCSATGRRLQLHRPADHDRATAEQQTRTAGGGPAAVAPARPHRR